MDQIQIQFSNDVQKQRADDHIQTYVDETMGAPINDVTVSTSKCERFDDEVLSQSETEMTRCMWQYGSSNQNCHSANPNEKDVTEENHQKIPGPNDDQGHNQEEERHVNRNGDGNDKNKSNFNPKDGNDAFGIVSRVRRIAPSRRMVCSKSIALSLACL